MSPPLSPLDFRPVKRTRLESTTRGADPESNRDALIIELKGRIDAYYEMTPQMQDLTDENRWLSVPEFHALFEMAVNGAFSDEPKYRQRR